MPRNQNYRKQVTADRKEEKGIIRDSKEEEPPGAKLKEKG
jgi:hypothetical protein